jgi:hypothetical protein
MIMFITAIARSLLIPIWREREREQLTRVNREGIVGVSTICTEQEKRKREKKENCCYTYVSRLHRTEGLKEKKFRSSSNIHSVT